MVDYQRSRILRGGKSVWRGSNKALALDEPWRPPMMWRIVTIASFGVIGATLGMWSADREPPVHILRANVLNQTVKPGEDLRIQYTVQRVRSCHTHIDRILYDSTNMRRDLDDVDFSASPISNGESTYIMGVAIPRNFAQGPARYRTIATYSCNPLQRNFYPIVVTNDDIEFTISGDPIEDENAPIEVIPRR